MSLEQLQRNMKFLGRHDLERLFIDQYRRFGEEHTIMADFATDERELEADVAAEGAAIDQVSVVVASNTQTISDLKGEVATLQGQGVDTSGMEAALATFEKNNGTLQALAPAAPSDTGTTKDTSEATNESGSLSGA